MDKKNIHINEKTQNAREKNANLWFYLILGIITGTVILYFVFSVFFANMGYFFNKESKFEYKNLTFYIEDLQGLTLYHYAYSSQAENGVVYDNNLYLRTDPRKNNISVEGKLLFGVNSTVYLTMNTSGLLNCPSIQRDASIIPFFLATNSLNTLIGLADETEAKTSNISYITCDKYPNSDVISIKAGNETKISKNNNCFAITIANCELLEASEKFEVQTIIDTQERQLK